MERGMCELFVGRALLGISQLTDWMPEECIQGESWTAEGGVRMCLQAFCKTLCLITQ